MSLGFSGRLEGWLPSHRSTRRLRIGTMASVLSSRAVSFEVEAAGFSAKKTEQFLQGRAAEQVEADAKWREAVEKMRLDMND